MNILTEIIKRLNARVEVSNMFDKRYGLSELNPDGKDKAWVHYVGNGQFEPITDFDAVRGTIWWVKRGRVSIIKQDNLKISGCKYMYQTTFPLTAYVIVKKDHLPCDSADAADYIANKVFHLSSGRDYGFKQALGVMSYEVVPTGWNTNIKDVASNTHWAVATIDLDVNIVTDSEDGCYDLCASGDPPLPPDYLPCRPCLTEVAVDGVTITGNGTPEDPLVAIGGGGGVNLRIQDEGTTVTNAATTINFTGNVQASLASAGNVTVNVPAPTQQVNSDWNASSGVAEILNKPAIPAAQIQSDWNQSNNAAVDFIKNKPTIPSIAGLVPYTGANTNVDLGAFHLSTQAIRVTGTNGNGDIHLRHQATDATATGQSTSIFADSNGDVKIKNDGLSYATFKTSLITADRIYTFPDKAGTVAMTSDVQVYTGGTGIDVTSNVITNTSPDQTVVLTAGTGIGVSGTYPNFTVSNTSPAPTVLKSTTDGTAITGNTNNNPSATRQVNAGLFSVGNWIRITARVRKTGVVSGSTFRLYVNATADLAGSPLLIGTFTITSTSLFNQITRHLEIKSSTVTEVFPSAVSLASDISASSSATTNVNIDWTLNRFFVFALQNSANADSTVVSGFLIEQL